MKRWALIGAAVLLSVAACGGSAGSDDDGVESNSAAVQTTDGRSASDETRGSGGEGNYASVRIGGASYDVPADPLNLCNSLDNLIFGSFAVDAAGDVTQAGGTEVAVQVNFGIPTVDWEAQGMQAPTLNVDLIGDGVRWFASVDLGRGSVDAWDLAGGLATGTATFEGETVGGGESVGEEQGGFEIRCR